MAPPGKRSILPISFCLFLGTLGACVIFGIMQDWPGTTADSTVYFAAAKSLLEGEGYSVRGHFLVQYPPVYPILLAGTDFFPGDMMQSAKVLNGLFFGLNITLVGLLGYFLAGRKLVAAFIAMAFFSLSAAMLEIHFMALSEAPFLLLCLVAVGLLYSYYSKQSWLVLFVLAMVIATAMMTRYVGVTLLPSFAVAMILFKNQSLRARIIRTATFLGTACLPSFLWFIRNKLLAGSSASLRLVIHPPTFEQLRQAPHALGAFLLGVDLPLSVRVFHLVMMTVLLGVGAVILYKKRGANPEFEPTAMTLLACLSFCIVYPSFLLLSITIANAYTPLDLRILCPVIVFLIPAMVGMVWQVADWRKNPVIIKAFVIGSLIILSINASQAVYAALSMRENGRGYTAKSYRESETLAFIQSVSGNTRVYSNGHDLVRFLTGIDTYGIPGKMEPTSNLPLEGFVEKMMKMHRDCLDGSAIIVMFDALDWRWYMASKDEVASLDGIKLLRTFSDGSVFGVSADMLKAGGDNR